MSNLSLNDLSSLEATATTAATYLDACDSGAEFVHLDPTYYQANGNLLLTIFAVTDPYKTFPRLMEHSAAAREIAESIEIGRRIEISRLGYYPQLTVILNRISG
ncbi:MAG: hypothetical protein H6R15_3934 [Proteobacteria bacterium]|nr:hypothetical protein [Pseudomonadota bacterium]